MNKLTVEEYERALRKHRSKSRKPLSENTIKWYLYHTAQYFENGQLHRPKTVDSLVDWMNMTLKTTNNPIMRAAFKHYLYHIGGKKDEIARLDVISGYRSAIRDEEELRHKVMSNRMIEQMIKLCDDDKIRLAIIILYETGMRKGELFGLKVKDIDFDFPNRNDEISRIGREHGLVAEVLIREGKGKKTREVYIRKLTGDLIKDLVEREQLRPESPLIVLYKNDGTPYKNQDSTLWNEIRKLGEVIGMEGVHPHMFRHSRATHLSEDGADPSEIQAVLGHANLQTTQIYVKVSRNKRVSAFSKYNNHYFDGDQDEEKKG